MIHATAVIGDRRLRTMELGAMVISLLALLCCSGFGGEVQGADIIVSRYRSPGQCYPESVMDVLFLLASAVVKSKLQCAAMCDRNSQCKSVSTRGETPAVTCRIFSQDTDIYGSHLTTQTGNYYREKVSADSGMKCSSDSSISLPVSTTEMTTILDPVHCVEPRGLGVLAAECVMVVSDEMCSPNGRYRLTFQNDGNLVLNDTVRGNVIWDAGTQHATAHQLKMQDDGNMVVYDQQGNPVWATCTNTGNADPYGLEITDDGRMLVWSANKTDVLWDLSGCAGRKDCMAPGCLILAGMSMFSSSRRYRLHLPSTGPIVFEDTVLNNVIWQAGTPQTSAAQFVVEWDGNLVLKDHMYTAVWASLTGNSPDPYGLEITDDGRLRHWSKDQGSVLWEVSG